MDKLISQLNKSNQSLNVFCTATVVYATVEKQVECEVNLLQPAQVRDVILQSGILHEFTEIDLNTVSVGIYAKRVSVDQWVEDGDRIEIYRPLRIDPKQARLHRVRNKHQKND